MANAIQPAPKVLDILHQAVMDGVLLEIQIDAEEKRYGARLLSLSTTPELEKKQATTILFSKNSAQTQMGVQPQNNSNPLDDDAPWMLMTPLEPMDGNLRIHKARTICIRFYRGLEQFQAEVLFRKVQLVNQTQAIELTWPTDLKITPIRQKPRVDVPDHVDLSVQIQQHGETGFLAKIMDISAGGLSFVCQKPSFQLPSGAKVSVTITSKTLLNAPIVTYGIIGSIAKARDRKDMQVAEQVYGLQFKLLSVTDAMAVDRLLKSLRTQSKIEPQPTISHQDILHQAVLDEVLLDIRLDDGDKQYGARLLSISPQKPADVAILSPQTANKGNLAPQDNDAQWILITPLEPTDGNLRIRKATKISLSFYRGLEQFQTEVLFRKVQLFNQGPAIELTWPTDIKSTSVRQRPRVEIPAHVDLSVLVQKRGEKSFPARVVDLSVGGLSFASQKPPFALQTGDQVSIAIVGEILLGSSITVYGHITSITIARDCKDVQVAKQVYGLKFKLLAVADAMIVDRLIKAMRTIIKMDNRATPKTISLPSSPQ